MLNIGQILDTITKAGSHLPAFKALFDQVVETFGDADQATLKDAYSKARAASDQAHGDLQDKLDAASRR